jgi:hypothetical protein
MDPVHIHIEEIAVVFNFNRNPPVLFGPRNQRLIPSKGVFQIQIHHNVFVTRLILGVDQSFWSPVPVTFNANITLSFGQKFRKRIG